VTLAATDSQAVDDMHTAVLDFQVAAHSQEGPPTTLPMAEFNEALTIATAQSTAAASDRCPAVTSYLDALEDSHSATVIEYRSAGESPSHREKLTIAESALHGLWLSHDDPHPDGELDGVMTRVQRVTVEMARREARALVYETG
jgi:hypothetical protein